MIDDVDVEMTPDGMALTFYDKGVIAEEILLEDKNIARELLSGLQACVSGRLRRYSSKFKKNGFNKPIENSDHNGGLRTT